MVCFNNDLYFYRRKIKYIRKINFLFTKTQIHNILNIDYMVYYVTFTSFFKKKSLLYSFFLVNFSFRSTENIMFLLKIVKKQIKRFIKKTFKYKKKIDTIKSPNNFF